MMESNPGLFVLLPTFRYLRPCDLLQASKVCKSWEFVASHPSYWQYVKLKNNKVRDWDKFGNVLSSKGTTHLDLIKMGGPDTNSLEDEMNMWEDVCRNIRKIRTLRSVKMGRCPPGAVMSLAEAAPNLEVLISKAIKGREMDFDYLANCPNLTVLKLKAFHGALEVADFSFLDSLPNLTTLSLLTVKDLNGIEKHLSPKLEVLELGECCSLPVELVTETLKTLVKLKRLRFEKGETGCPTIEILNAVASHPTIEHLDLINFDILPGFDNALERCKNIKTLLIFPTYAVKSSTTNHILLNGVLKLKNTLKYFIWGLTLELIKVTDMFLEQIETAEESELTIADLPKEQRIPINQLAAFMTVPEYYRRMISTQRPLHVDFIELPRVHKILSALLPTTRIRFLKVPYSATWRQFITDA